MAVMQKIIRGGTKGEEQKKNKSIFCGVGAK
jgi:hypothetical protein